MKHTSSEYEELAVKAADVYAYALAQVLATLAVAAAQCEHTQAMNRFTEQATQQGEEMLRNQRVHSDFIKQLQQPIGDVSGGC